MTATLKGDNKPTIFIWGDYKEKNRLNPIKTDKIILDRFYQLIDEVYLIVNTKNLSDHSLEIFRTAMADKSRTLWEESGKWIMQFSHYFIKFEQLILELMNSNSSQVRLRTIQSLWDYFPTENCVQKMLESGIFDSNKKVKSFTIDRILMFRRRDQLSNLKIQLDKEVDEEIKIHLKNVISFFEKGYYIRPSSEEKVSITFPDNKGRLASFFMDRINLTEDSIKKEITQQNK
jgi:hypothetical protein